MWHLVHSFGQRPIYSGYLLTFPLVFALVLPSVTKTVLLLCKHVQLCGQKWRIVRGEGTLTAQQKFHTNQQNTELTMLNKTQHTHKEQKPEQIILISFVRRWLCGKCRSWLATLKCAPFQKTLVCQFFSEAELVMRVHHQWRLYNWCNKVQVTFTPCFRFCPSIPL